MQHCAAFSANSLRFRAFRCVARKRAGCELLDDTRCPANTFQVGTIRKQFRARRGTPQRRRRAPKAPVHRRRQQRWRYRSQRLRAAHRAVLVSIQDQISVAESATRSSVYRGHAGPARATRTSARGPHRQVAQQSDSSPNSSPAVSRPLRDGGVYRGVSFEAPTGSGKVPREGLPWWASFVVWPSSARRLSCRSRSWLWSLSAWPLLPNAVSGRYSIRRRTRVSRHRFRRRLRRHRLLRHRGTAIPRRASRSVSARQYRSCRFARGSERVSRVRYQNPHSVGSGPTGAPKQAW